MRNVYNPDKQSRRKRKAIIHIVCEGTKTELQYFKHFRTRECLVDVRPIASQYRSALQLVQHAKSTLGVASYSSQDGDELWCVFDCDANTNVDLSKTEVLAKKQGYGLAFSNPCFEYWYALHFAQIDHYLADAKDVIKCLNKLGLQNPYKKSADIYGELYPRMQKALVNAARRVLKIEEEEITLISRDSNPITTVHLLVKHLLALSGRK